MNQTEFKLHSRGISKDDFTDIIVPTLHIMLALLHRRSPLAYAILDRLTGNAHRFELKGESLKIK